ncbi:MAG: type II toxin-antitoxin system HicA family toxin [Firmicutes bacterium]|nr:type II toxin-antitoxin system HicA family toxin [Bacillota bacterium]
MRLPAITGRALVAALQRGGFLVGAVKGSHYHLYDPRNPARWVVVPVHAGKTLKPGTLHAILKQAGLTPAELMQLL